MHQNSDNKEKERKNSVREDGKGWGCCERGSKKVGGVRMLGG